MVFKFEGFGILGIRVYRVEGFRIWGFGVCPQFHTRHQAKCALCAVASSQVFETGQSVENNVNEQISCA